MKKRISFILAVVMIMAVMVSAIPVSADTYASTKDTTAVTITTPADYKAFYEEMVAGTQDFSGKTVTLADNIVLNDTSAENWVESATVLSENDANGNWTAFKGTFDGNGKTISGVYIKGSHTGAEIAAMFPMTQGATIQNFTVDGFYIELDRVNAGQSHKSTFNNAGVIVGRAVNNLTIDNVTIKNGQIGASVDNANVGAVVAATRMDGGIARTGCLVNIKNTTVEPTVSIFTAEDAADTYTGGLVGCFNAEPGGGYADEPIGYDVTGTVCEVAGTTNAVGGFGGVCYDGEYKVVATDFELVGDITGSNQAENFTAAMVAANVFNTYAGSKAEETVVISSVRDYLAFYKDLATTGENQGTGFLGQTVVLAHDIVLNDTTAADWATNAPVALNSAAGKTSSVWSHGFYGTFDGQGHTIKGAYLNDYVCAAGNIGLFPFTKNATLKNFTLDGFSFNLDGAKKEGGAAFGWPAFYVGALVGQARDSITIDNVVVKNGSLSSTTIDAYIGGLIGVQRSELATADSSFNTYITNTTVSDITITPNSENSIVGGIMGSYNPANKVNYIGDFNITATYIDTEAENAIGVVLGSATAVEYSVLNTLKNVEPVTGEVTADVNATLLTELNAAIAAVAGDEIANIKLLGAQKRADDDAIRFVGVVMDFEELDELGFAVLVDRPDQTDLIEAELAVTTVYEDFIFDIPAGYEEGYLFTFVIYGDIPEDTVFTVGAYSIAGDVTACTTFQQFTYIPAPVVEA